MQVQDILTAIASVGFPIVACCGMAYFFARVNNNYREDIRTMNTEHKEEVQTMTQAINNNTLVIQRLVDEMGDIKK